MTDCAPRPTCNVMTLLRVFLTLIVLTLAAPVLKVLSRLVRRNNGLIDLRPDDAAMATAIANARATLPEWRRLFEAPEPGMTKFALKVALPVANGGHEHCWAGQLEVRDDGYFGRLTVQPNGVPGMHLDSPLFIRQDQITDWSYTLNGVYYGHYTTRVLLPHLPAAMRRQVTALYGWDEQGEARAA